MEKIMAKYVVFIKNDKAKAIAKAIPKDAITHSLVNEMKKDGYRKHFVEVDAENEKEAVSKLNEHNDGYLKSLGDFSGSIVIISSVVILMALIYFFR